MKRLLTLAAFLIATSPGHAAGTGAGCDHDAAVLQPGLAATLAGNWASQNGGGWIVGSFAGQPVAMEMSSLVDPEPAQFLHQGGALSLVAAEIGQMPVQFLAADDPGQFNLDYPDWPDDAGQWVMDHNQAGVDETCADLDLPQVRIAGQMTIADTGQPAAFEAILFVINTNLLSGMMVMRVQTDGADLSARRLITFLR